MVRRARRQLEALRLLRWASRGALLGAALALMLLLLDKATAGSVVSLAFGWWLPLFGALAGLGAALARPSIEPVAAALYLDRRCGTDERFVTLWSLPRSAHATEWAKALASVRRLPHLPLPREAGLLPVGLFLLFAASLLPAADGAEHSQGAGALDETSEAAPSEGAQPGEKRIQPERGEQLLRERVALTDAARDEIERAIERGFVRPEERAAARAELARALAGDVSARDRLANALLEGAGALGENAGPSEKSKSATRVAPAAAAAGAAGDDGAAVSPYPDDVRFLRAYRIERARLLRVKGKLPRERGRK